MQWPSDCSISTHSQIFCSLPGFIQFGWSDVLWYDKRHKNENAMQMDLDLVLFGLVGRWVLLDWSTVNVMHQGKNQRNKSADLPEFAMWHCFVFVGLWWRIFAVSNVYKCQIKWWLALDDAFSQIHFLRNHDHLCWSSPSVAWMIHFNQWIFGEIALW